MPDKTSYMTWGALKERMKDVPDDTPLVLSRDEEGNGFSPLAHVTTGVYRPEETWFGEFSAEPDADADEADREYFEDLKEDPTSVQAHCLWPLN